YTSSNTTATHTLTNAVGCDSVVRLDLTINPPTLCNPPTCLPITNIISTMTSNGAIINWDTVGSAMHYELRYREVGTSALSYGTTATNSFTFNNLQSNTCYEFAVRTFCDSLNTSPWSIGQSFCFSVCSAPSNITTTTTVNAAQLNWMAMGNAEGYEIRYREIGTSALSYATTPMNSITLGNLKANACYEFSIRTQCDSTNFSSWLRPAQSFCLSGCAAPSTITTTTTANSAQLNWMALGN
ncbi:MAG: fibronectin type III domain-containing protein, partial [Aureispira sp.]